MIIEYFSFYNEFDMLELKLQEHAPYLDQFVITESNRTYNQIEKPYRLEQQWDRYAQWHDKIKYVKFDAQGLDAGWPTEEIQREHGIRTHVPSPSDIVLISDLDEFLTPREFHYLEQNIDKGKREILFNMSCYWCFADVLHQRKQKTIAATRYARYVDSTTHRRPQKKFEHLSDPMHYTDVVEGGVHLTWMGDKAQFEQKMQGSIEGYNWTQGKSGDELWRHKQDNKLFHWKPKFKKGSTTLLPLDQNKEMTTSMKQFILKNPNWILNN